MKTISELIALSAEYLKANAIEHSRRAAEELIADALKLTKLELYLAFDKPIEGVEIDEIRKRLSRRAKGEPWQYITGEVDFYYCKIKVSPDVLIPRQETEILVGHIANELSSVDLKGKALLDLCAGSGCIGLALKNRFADLHVTLADISHSALQVAAENARNNELFVEIVEGDFLEAVKGRKFDFIVCNPPYIDEKSYETLEASVKNFEPKLALQAKDGVEFYRQFARDGRDYLKAPGKVWFEIGFDQGPLLLKLFEGLGWKNPKVEKDWSGQDRFFSLEIE